MIPKLSVIIPVYNSESRLNVALNSLFQQTFRDFEVILVDDGSTDKSSVICQDYAQKDSRFRVINQKNGGVSKARNRGIEVAQGEFIYFMDSDDTIEPHTFIEIFENTTLASIDLIIFGMKFEYFKKERLKSVKEFRHEELLIGISEVKQSFLSLYQSNYLSSACNKIIKRSLITRHHLQFDSEMAILEDFSFTLDLLNVASKILILSSPFYNYYNNLAESNLNRRPNLDYIKNFDNLSRKLVKFADSYDFDELMIGSVYTLVFRFYLIPIERLIVVKDSIKSCFLFIEHIFENEYMNVAINKAIIKQRYLGIVRLLFKLKMTKIIYLVLYLKIKFR
jgi:glycosyltransferase involved in cell wall biosynthesis